MEDEDAGLGKSKTSYAMTAYTTVSSNGSKWRFQSHDMAQLRKQQTAECRTINETANYMVAVGRRSVAGHGINECNTFDVLDAV